MNIFKGSAVERAHFKNSWVRIERSSNLTFQRVDLVRATFLFWKSVTLSKCSITRTIGDLGQGNRGEEKQRSRSTGEWSIYSSELCNRSASAVCLWLLESVQQDWPGKTDSLLPGMFPSLLPATLERILGIPINLCIIHSYSTNECYSWLYVCVCLILFRLQEIDWPNEIVK